MKAVFEVQTYSDIKNFNLNSRAWVFQERLLSPRIVHYNGSEVYWECHELFASDLFPTGHPKIPMNRSVSRPRFDWHVPANVTDPYKHWLSLVTEYNTCNLTMPTDRFPGIAAVAKRMNDTYFNEEYIAGFYKSQLPAALEWRRKKFAALQFPGPDYVSPSWSWASVHGPLEFPRSAEETVAILKSYTADVVDKRNQYGQISHARLVIESEVLRVPSKSPSTLKGRKTVLLGHMITKGQYITYTYQWPFPTSRSGGRKQPPLTITMDIEIDWDRGAADDAESWHLLCISKLSGIVIVPSPVVGENERPVYKRVGVWYRYIWNGDWEEVVLV